MMRFGMTVPAALSRPLRAAALGMLLGAAGASPAMAQEDLFFGVNMYGEYVPDGGGADEDAGGRLSGEIDFAAGRLCYYLEYFELRGVTGAEIHQGATGENGPMVVQLPLPASADDETCVNVAPDVLSAINDNLAGYYVVLMDPVHAEGAVRAQMSD